jgi:hypothetical protein
MSPQDILIWLRVSCGLDDEEIVPALLAGADALERSANPACPELSDADRALAIAQARSVTNSRVTGWRRRHRQMTWLELRALFAGLREDI